MTEMGSGSGMQLGHEPVWGILDIRYSDHTSKCDHCGSPTKRLILLEHAMSGERIWVGRVCARRLTRVAA